MKPIGDIILGDQEAVKKAAEAVAAQSKGEVMNGDRNQNGELIV